MLSRFSSGLFFSVLILNLLSCTPSSQKKKTFSVAIPGEVVTLDWTKASDSVSKGILENLVPRLMSFSMTDGRVVVVPGLLKSMKSLDKDGKLWWLELPNDVTWSDGVQLSIDHVLLGLKRAASEEVGSPCYSQASKLFGSTEDEWSARFSKVSDKKIKVLLKKPSAQLPLELSKICYSPARKLQTDENGNLITLGPFQIESRKPGTSIFLSRRNTSAGMVNDIKLQMNIEPATGLKLFQSGKTDLLPWLPPGLMKEVDKKSRFVREPIRTTFLVFNTKSKAFDSKEKRQAFASLVKVGSFRQVLGEAHREVESFLPQSIWTSEFKPRVASGEFDAKTSLEVLTHNSEFSKRWLQRLQYLLNEKGVVLKIKSLDWKSYLQEMKNASSDLIRVSWRAEAPSPVGFLQLFVSDSKLNRTNWNSNDYDELVRDLSSTRDSSEFGKLVNKAIDVVVNEETLVLPLFENSDVQVINKDSFEGFNPNPFLTYDFSSLRWK